MVEREQNPKLGSFQRNSTKFLEILLPSFFDVLIGFEPISLMFSGEIVLV